jgi:glycosyltransferase involved in cell wall biosynthesis
MEYQIMEKRPFVSVLLPVYNGENYLATAITTVINQTDQDYELIVSIDSSSDFSERIAREFEENNERIRVHTHVNRLGMRGNYDFLISKAKGSWLTILGQDDAMMPFAVSELRKSIEKVPDMSALVSRRAYAFWSDTEQKFGQNQFIYPMGVNRASEVSSKKFLVNCLKGKSEYSQGPQLYTGSFVSQEVVLNFLAIQGGELFPYPIPDVSSSASILLSTRKFHYSNLPLFIVGTSGSSTGVLIDKALENRDEVLSVENTYLDAFNGRSKSFDTPGLGVFSSFAWYLFEATIAIRKGESLSQIKFNSAWALEALKAENTRKRRNQLEFKETYLKLRGTLGRSYVSVQTRFIFIRLFQLKNFISKYIKGVTLFAGNRLILEKFDKEFNMVISIENASKRLNIKL